MLYFAYGSNLNHFQMRTRCKDSSFIKKFILKNYKLTFRSIYRAADIEKNSKFEVPGAIFKISKSDEKKLDLYEDYPILYKKSFFILNNQKVMFYEMVNKTLFMYPAERYLNVIKKGYKDCKLNEKYLIKALNQI